MPTGRTSRCEGATPTCCGIKATATLSVPVPSSRSRDTTAPLRVHTPGVIAAHIERETWGVSRGGVKTARRLNTEHATVSDESQLMHWSACLAALVVVAASSSQTRAQSTPLSPPRSTGSGVYTAEQAARGRDTYAMQCKSCHTPASHTGAVFASWWDRKPLSELYQFVMTRMPKNEPGSLAPGEYAEVVAYLLKLNDMPTGTEELPADSVALKKIRIETGKKDP